MPSLFFPQVSSGALAQYPLRKTRHFRTVLNSLADGSIIAAADAYSGRLKWELVYQDLSASDLTLLQNHFAACYGPWQPFVFIDPAGNMLSDSANLGATTWLLGSNVSVQAGAEDPFGSTNAFVITNAGQTTQQISQTLTVPAAYQYCFSIYARSEESSQVSLVRQADSQQSVTLPVSNTWTRLTSSGQLSTNVISLTVSVSLAPGQQVSLFGPQLEPQAAPSRYRPTVGKGGVYSNAHWSLNNFTVSADSPSRFNATCVIETNL